MKITVLGILAVAAVGIVIYVLWQRSQNQGGEPDKPNESPQW